MLPYPSSLIHLPFILYTNVLFFPHLCTVGICLAALVTAVSDAVEQMICHFSAAQNQAHCSILGDSSHTPACAQLALSKLCPALYAVLSDGLQPTLHTAFGSVQNSVWQVVEASAQQGKIKFLCVP
jgi:hypothetical protein